MFDFSHLSDDDKIARDVFRGKQDAVAKLGDTPNDSMKPHLRSMFVNEYRKSNKNAYLNLPDSLVAVAFDDAYRVTPKGNTAGDTPYGTRLKNNFIDMVSCYEDGEFGCW